MLSKQDAQGRRWVLQLSSHVPRPSARLSSDSSFLRMQTPGRQPHEGSSGTPVTPLHLRSEPGKGALSLTTFQVNRNKFFKLYTTAVKNAHCTIALLVGRWHSRRAGNSPGAIQGATCLVSHTTCSKAHTPLCVYRKCGFTVTSNALHRKAPTLSAW